MSGAQEPAGVGFIGCGEISWQYVQGCGQFPSLELRAFADADRARADALAGRAGVGRACTVEELLADPGVEVVVNLTPPGAHAEVSMQAIEAGKHVYSEKPLGLDLASAAAVVRAAQDRGVVLGGAPDTVLGAAVQDSRQLLDDGWIGEPRAGIAVFASHGYEFFHPRPQYLYSAGGGPVLDMGPYYVTTLVHLLGPVARVQGAHARFDDVRRITSEAGHAVACDVETETHFAGTLEFASGALVSLTVSWEMWRTRSPCIELHGTEGSLDVPNPDFFDGEPSVLRPGLPELRDEQLRGPEGWRTFPSTHRNGLGRGVGVAELVEHVRHGTPHRTSGAVVLHVLEVLFALRQSAATAQPVSISSSCPRPPAMPRAVAGQATAFHDPD